MSRGKLGRPRRLRKSGNSGLAPDPLIGRRPLTKTQLETLGRHNALDRRLRATSRWIERWAVGQGRGLPLSPEEADMLPSVKPPPLSEDDLIMTDLVIVTAPKWAKEFVRLWYRTPKSRELIAEELNLSVRAVYLEHKVVLAYFLGSFREAGLPIPLWETDT